MKLHLIQLIKNTKKLVRNKKILNNLQQFLLDKHNQTYQLLMLHKQQDLQHDQLPCNILVFL